MSIHIIASTSFIEKITKPPLLIQLPNYSNEIEEIHISSEIGNDLRGHFQICDYPNLIKILISCKCFRNVTTLSICNNERLEQFIVENMEGINLGEVNKEDIVDYNTFTKQNKLVENAFCNVHTVKFECTSLTIIILLILLLDLPKLESICIGNYSFIYTQQLFLKGIFLFYLCNRIDLPELKGLHIGDRSLGEMKDLNMMSN